MFPELAEIALDPGQQAGYSNWKTHMAVGRMAADRGLYAAAARNYQNALRTSRHLSLSSQELISNLLGLATCACKLENVAESENLVKRILKIESTLSHPDQRNVALDLNCLAVIYQELGRFVEAEALLRRALALAEACVPPDGTAVATMGKNLAIVLFNQGRIDEAEAFIVRANNICDTRSSRQTKLFAEILNTRAVIAAGKARYIEAEQFLNEAIEILELLTGGEHPELANLLDFAAALGEKIGGGQKSDSLITRASSIRRHLRQIDH